MRTLRWSLVMMVSAVSLFVAGCDDNDPPRPDSTTQAVLDLASQTSETAEPFAVNNGAFVFNDTSETSEAAAINR
ncbi:MAG TPA: hypothetical protein VGE57_03750 [Solimonas sp.]